MATDETVTAPGEPSPGRAFRLPGPRGLGPYLWDVRTMATVCRACGAGSRRIITAAWRWCRAAQPGDRLWRGLSLLAAAAGVVAADVYYAAPYAPHLLRAGAPRGIVTAAVTIVPAWLVAALVAAPSAVWKTPASAAPDAEPGTGEPLGEPVERLSEENLVERDRRVLLALLDEATRGRNGVHLGELHQLVVAHPLFRDVPRHNLTALLDALGVPFERTLSVDGVAGRSGVRRATVEALLAGLPLPGPQAPSQPGETGPDLRKSQPLSDGSQAALGPVSRAV